eukprot:12498624-Prorocentrum_lima.AAC.1
MLVPTMLMPQGRAARDAFRVLDVSKELAIRLFHPLLPGVLRTRLADARVVGHGHSVAASGGERREAEEPGSQVQQDVILQLHHGREGRDEAAEGHRIILRTPHGGRQ